MKKIIFVRHAKSSWDDPSQKDHDRELNKRGEESAKIMKKVLKHHLKECDQIFSSTAKRAKQTIEIIANDEFNVIFKDELYTFDFQILLGIIKQFDHSLNKVVVVGHNPAFTDIVNALSPNKIFNLPTCGAVGLLWEDAKHWVEIENQPGRLVLLDTPRNYKY